VDEEMSQNTVGLAAVARILKNVITNALNHQKTWNDTIRNLEQLVDYQSSVSCTMRELEFMVIQLQQSVMRLQEGLDTSTTGRLSSVLILPHNLSRILREVILKLPQDVSLIAGFTIENMYVYYEVAKVQAYAPTTAKYSEVLGRHLQIKPETLYLAATENGQYYSLLMTADLQHCQLGLFAICETTFPFIYKTRASCSSALYFGQAELAHENCRKFILKENCNPVWLQAKGIYPFWIYSLPSPTVVTKKCKENGTTQSSTLRLSHTGTLTEDAHCQFYSEAFVLLPVSDEYTNMTITDSQVLFPHVPELISPKEHNQIMHDETRTHWVLAALETVVRRSSSTKQQSYVELRELLATISSEETITSQITWVYALIVFSIVLSFVVLTFRCWRRPFLTMFHRLLPWRTAQRPSTDLEMTHRSSDPTTDGGGNCSQART
jgi:hypothetical protein